MEYFIQGFFILVILASAYGLVKGAIDIKKDGNILLDEDKYTKKKMKGVKKL